ncbi:MAG: acyl-protein synthetase, partial [Pseudomonadota bacterium]|nr:acyl-protein synthetase [Pseudomonadota bacterium]
MISADLDDLLRQPPFGLRQAEKERSLLPLLNALTRHHMRCCEPYRHIVNLTTRAGGRAETTADVPYLPISLFKFRRLRSIDSNNIRVTVSSSGTSGSQKSQVELDVETAKLSSRALNLVIGQATQGRRLPMLIIDTEASITNTGPMGARAAAILGLMPFGRNHHFALREDFSLDEEALQRFLKTHAGEEIFIYGFTFLIWQHFVPAAAKKNYDLSRSLLMHSGGWKTLQRMAVGNEEFRGRLKQTAGITRVINFYGMAELPGTIFLECDNGAFTTPHFADVIIRDPVTLTPVPEGSSGLIQILSAIPHSYPGHSLLTEDIGFIEATDTGVGGRYGHRFRVTGRA